MCAMCCTNVSEDARSEGQREDLSQMVVKERKEETLIGERVKNIYRTSGKR